ncbi:hypothetical protein EDD18DRAFT_1356921 [Armillaria luteobubalina]|uniref:Uncharacterized protein n=1 Tax=Armillaria luteobubalina TaxID=153913 RepID=A0AA39UUK2_9AGAR|nr:hypothetical protein EDD18DRAFT_1356921 [Armillaria luteobubalina]
MFTVLLNAGIRKADRNVIALLPQLLLVATKSRYKTFGKYRQARMFSYWTPPAASEPRIYYAALEGSQYTAVYDPTLVGIIYTTKNLSVLKIGRAPQTPPGAAIGLLLVLVPVLMNLHCRLADLPLTFTIRTPVVICVDNAPDSDGGTIVNSRKAITRHQTYGTNLRARGAISSKDTRPAISGISQIASSRHVSLSPMFQGVHRESLVRMVEDYRWRPISPSTKGREQWIFRSEGLSTARYPPSASPPSPAVDDVQLDLVPAQAVKPSPKAMFT